MISSTVWSRCRHSTEPGSMGGEGPPRDHGRRPDRSAIPGLKKMRSGQVKVKVIISHKDSSCDNLHLFMPLIHFISS